MYQMPLMCKHPDVYDALAICAQRVGDELLRRLDIVALQPNIIVEVGAATGYHLPFLQNRYPKAKLIALDLHLSLLQFAKSKAISLCAATERLPFPDQSIDLLIANMVLPWCVSFNAVLQEWHRVLRPEGLLIFTSLGPNTLKQLQTPIIPTLTDMHEVGDALIQTGFQDPILDVDNLTFTYRDAETLSYELQITDMLSKESRLPAFTGIFPITYEVIFGHAWGNTPKDHVAKIPVHAILRMDKPMS